MGKVLAHLLSCVVAISVAACASAPPPSSPVVELAEDVVVGPDDVLIPPQPLRKDACPYPPELRRSGLRGRVVAKFVINREGRPTDLEILEANHPFFAESVLRTVPDWRFKPAMRNGAPVATYYVLTVSFSAPFG
jgi:protein TonB